MKEMGWDYWTFQNQPDWFINMIHAFLFAEKAAGAKLNNKDKYGRSGFNN
jgi:hypothetical protein